MTDRRTDPDPLHPPPDVGPPAATPVAWVVPRWMARTWVATGIVGILAALVGGVVGIGFVGSATAVSIQALDLTDTVLTGVEDTAAVLDTTFTNVATTLATVQDSVDDAAVALTQVGTTLDDLTVLVTEDVPDSLDAVNDAMPQLIQTAGVIDSTFRALSFLGVDYDPDAPLDESLQAVQAQLADIPPELRRQREGLDDVGGRLDDLAGQGGDIAGDLTVITDDLETSRDLVADYRATATEASLLVDDLADRLTTQSRIARVVIGLLALAVALGQTVPLVLGLQALRSTPAEP